MQEEDDEGYSGPPSPTDSINSGSELATGAGSIQEEDQDVDNMADELSDTGWETDLEIEGMLRTPVEKLRLNGEGGRGAWDFPLWLL